MKRALVVVLAFAFMLVPSASADEGDGQQASGGVSGNGGGDCDVYRENHSGGVLNRYIVDPDGCFRAYLQEVLDIGSRSNSEEEDGG